MTDAEYITVTAERNKLIALQTYRDGVDGDTDPATSPIFAGAAVSAGLGDAIKSAWLAAIDADLATATTTFGAFTGTNV